MVMTMASTNDGHHFFLSLLLPIISHLFLEDLQIISSADIYILAIIWNRQNIKILQIKYRQVTINFTFLFYLFLFITLINEIRRIRYESYKVQQPHSSKKLCYFQHSNDRHSNWLFYYLRYFVQNTVNGHQYQFRHCHNYPSHSGGRRYLYSKSGFGLVLSYLKRLLWSGIGFTFFITAFCIEMYPLVNAFWTKTRIQNNDIVSDFSTTNFSLYLSNANLPTGQLYGNCITNALKCALAVMAAFSSILGRAGPLQCFITSVFGIIGFQLNRQVISNLSSDIFGTYYIFTFGGFMGLALGIILKFK